MASPRTPRVLPPEAKHSRRSAMLMLTGVLASAAPLPYTAVAVIPLVWAGVEAVRAIQVRSDAQASNRGIVTSVLGLVLVCALTVMVLLPYAFYGTYKGLQDCTRGANTAVAIADCKAQYGGLDSVVGGFLSSE